MIRAEIVAYLESYTHHFGAPVREGAAVHSVRSMDGSGFLLETSSGALSAVALVPAIGAFQRSRRQAGAATLPADLLQMDVQDYGNPAAPPPGKVLVVGSGQSGAQLAEELHEAGRAVCLSCGRAPWVPRRLGGRDIVWWLIESAIFDQPSQSPKSSAARLISNPLAIRRGHLRGGFRPDHL